MLVQPVCSRILVIVRPPGPITIPILLTDTCKGSADT